MLVWWFFLGFSNFIEVELIKEFKEFNLDFFVVECQGIVFCRIFFVDLCGLKKLKFGYFQNGNKIKFCSCDFFFLFFWGKILKEVDLLIIGFMRGIE